MATSKEYLAYILEQLSEIDNISYRQMMGEYIIYHNGKIAAYLCDDRLLVKIVPSAEKCFRRLCVSRHTTAPKICFW